MFSSIDEAFEWIESFTNLEKNAKDLKRRYRPDRMQALLEQFGNPQYDFKVIHAAGSKGKGSVCALLSSALTEGGFKTGFYSSPHVLHYKERIRVNGTSLPDENYVRMISFIRDSISSLPGNTDPTTFELLTLLGFLLFQEEGCDWAVVETGLGGRLDATNTVLPDAVVLMPVELEHTQWLGNSLKAIAAEKAGIIKAGRPVFSALQEPVVREVFRKHAEEKKSELVFIDERLDRIDYIQEKGFSRYTLVYRDGHLLKGELSMVGKIQAWNAALALEVLMSLYPEMDSSLWLQGFHKAQLPARMQILSLNPLRILDGSHTPRSTGLALEGFLSMADAVDNKVLLFACQDDKDVEAMSSLLAPEFSRIIITSPGFFKKSDPTRVYKSFKEKNTCTQLISDPAEALSDAEAEASALLILGSFFLAGEILKIYGEE